jgi:hypothetical protein
MMNRIPILILLAFMATGLVACQQEGLVTANLLLEGEHSFSSGERLPGIVVIMGGSLELEEGAFASGPIYLLGGRLESNGEISGDVALLGGVLILGNQAYIGGDLNLSGGEASLASGATIVGSVNTGVGLGAPDPPMILDNLRGQLPFILAQAIILAGLAFLTVSILPRPVKRVSNAMVRHPIVSLAMGLLVGIVGMSLLVLMAFTIILIPISIFAGFIFLLAIIFGFIGYGLALGQVGAKWLKRGMDPAPAAAVGTSIFVLLINMIALIPIIEGVIPLLLAATGLGAVFLTRFGFSEFIPVSDRPEAELE